MFSRIASSAGRLASGARRGAFAQPRRKMGGGGGAAGPHVPEGYDKLGKLVLVSAFFWIFYRARENKGQLFGLYAPWLDVHDHAHHHFEREDLDSIPEIAHADHDEEEE